MNRVRELEKLQELAKMRPELESLKQMLTILQGGGSVSDLRVVFCKSCSEAISSETYCSPHCIQSGKGILVRDPNLVEVREYLFCGVRTFDPNRPFQEFTSVR